MSAKLYYTNEERLAARRNQYSKNRTNRIAQTRRSQIKRRQIEPDIGSRQYKRRLEIDPRWNQRIALRKYGLSLEDYDKLIENQDGLCAICFRPSRAFLNGKVKALAVDHDPRKSKKEIRGLLCESCNRALGLFQDNPDVLVKAAEYLNYWRTIYG